ncbi:HIT family protein [Solimicrobium silvestre]|nr:HIT family protein [Solimicrobium silvestre]
MTKCEPCELCSTSGDVIIQSAEWRVILVDDAHYPGFCRVIWTAHVQEMSDLSVSERTMLMNVVWQVELAIREVMRPHKINLASFGNMVPHLHWHVIPRFTDDMHFPNPIWGQVERSVNPGIQQRQLLIPALRSAIVHRLTED